MEKRSASTGLGSLATGAVTALAIAVQAGLAAVVGVIIALFQALTQIQEQTLVFVPKIIAIFVTMLLTLPFLGATMGGYMNRVVDMIIVGG